MHPFKTVVMDWTVRACRKKDSLTLKTLLAEIHEGQKELLQLPKDWITKVKLSLSTREAYACTKEAKEGMGKAFIDLINGRGRGSWSRSDYRHRPNGRRHRHQWPESYTAQPDNGCAAPRRIPNPCNGVRRNDGRCVCVRDAVPAPPAPRSRRGSGGSIAMTIALSLALFVAVAAGATPHIRERETKRER
jgi:hypothetical protein